MLCARDIDYLRVFRDTSWETPLPEVVPPCNAEYRAQELMELADREGALRAMTLSECAEAQDRERKRIILQNAKERAGSLEKHARLTQMLEQVSAWQAPERHTGLKKFMVEMLDWDLRCGIYDPEDPPLLSPEAWRAERLREVTGELQYQRETAETEQRIAALATAWLRELRESLP